MIVVFGSVNVDLIFEVPNLPAPGETVLCPGHTLGPGGKGANQAAAAAKAGAEVFMVGKVGSDENGQTMRGILQQAGVRCRHLEAAEAHPTGIAIIGVDPRGENSIIVASGANLAVDAAQLDGLDLGADVWLLCQNELGLEATTDALARAKARGARTVWNLAPSGAIPLAALDPVDILVVNEIEAAGIGGEDTDAGGMGDPVRLARALSGRHGLAVVLTLGGRGAVAAMGDRCWRIGALPVTVKDTTGAGDAFAGGLTAALDRGLDLPEALRFASVGAALSCTRLGAQEAQPTASEIEARLGDLPPAELLP
ncbi:ribokinase [Marinivivus vitaminiproducens]|uniref:ribokinase n=1 Tax=Marinivivus vitaminiproducens TaxID=3035935 RepID=UPI0027A749FD|nr:ribokinase [Geminicoccaceae bacterium SCSIO 64248]